MGEGLTSSAKASFVDNWIYLQQALGYASRRIKDIKHHKIFLVYLMESGKTAEFLQKEIF